jgi:hypothetical protein
MRSKYACGSMSAPTPPSPPSPPSPPAPPPSSSSTGSASFVTDLTGGLSFCTQCGGMSTNKTNQQDQPTNHSYDRRSLAIRMLCWLSWQLGQHVSIQRPSSSRIDRIACRCDTVGKLCMQHHCKCCTSHPQRLSDQCVAKLRIQCVCLQQLRWQVGVQCTIPNDLHTRLPVWRVECCHSARSLGFSVFELGQHHCILGTCTYVTHKVHHTRERERQTVQ